MQDAPGDNMARSHGGEMKSTGQITMSVVLLSAMSGEDPQSRVAGGR